MSAILCWCSWSPESAWAAAPPASALDSIRQGTNDAGFALAVGPRTFEFPRDHGPHPQFRHEWWYVTGNLDSDTGERFGFELTFFRIGLVPLDKAEASALAADTVASGGARPAAGGVESAGARPATGGVASSAGAKSSAWRTRQIYAAHFAITDVARRQFHFAEKFSRAALGLAGAQAEPFRVWLDDWVLDGSQLHAQGAGYDLTLSVEPLTKPVLNGDQGLSQKASEVGAASYYYSVPRVTVHGKLTRAGVVSQVRGLAWLDREWGSGSLGSTEQGWDWFALQLQDGSALMFYSLRNRDGTRESHSAGTWVDPAGHSRPLSADQVVIDVLDHWKSPAGGRYPSRWRVRVPEVGLDVEARPVLADQELRTQPRYWEGAVDLRGTRDGREAAGRGYVELVGYGE
jgi:predicted secreted hydrolase